MNPIDMLRASGLHPIVIDENTDFNDLSQQLGIKPMNRLEDIRNWAHDRNIIKGATPHAQFVKLIEEVGELAHGIAKDRLNEVVDGIGDAVVVLTVLAAQHNVYIEDCIEAAWNEIKDRRGKMINGVFVKESDLPTEGA